ncbi:hypothetical protein KDH_74260 [Dictyobacter sp. S3.2.2.5]|uniref:N-acetyltransferase domain-containing protein n=2 Tax=Dictyobacter halimunensis TaxID=3026934 RepID=A0ABQ6G3C1_9CHLR|nr:hypothetical protein KDH_74260 [Dictyobacter sp. S3.2.2.5]
MGVARIPMACVSVVFTHPAFRKQGVATALMQDAIAFATSHQRSLLLLDGIPKFYYRYGYTDVFDLSSYQVDRNAILAQAAGNYAVRTVTPEDATPLLALYERHYGSYTGSFVRSLDQQRYMLEYQATRRHMVASLGPEGVMKGYLLLSAASHPHTALECVADDWEALLSLLQYHAHLHDGLQDIPQSLHYRLPPTSPMVRWMREHLEVPDTSEWETGHEEWSVLRQTYHHRYAGCMARLVHFPSLLEAVLPELQRRWRQTLACWEGAITLIVGTEAVTLHISGRRLWLSASEEASVRLQMSPQSLTQLVFGYVPISWGLKESNLALSHEVLAALTNLFPVDHTWIPGSDWP